MAAAAGPVIHAGEDLLAGGFFLEFKFRYAQENVKTSSMHLRAKHVLTFLRMNVVEWH